MAVQGGCGQSDVPVDDDEAGHLKRFACCGAPLPQPYGEALKGSSEDYGIPTWDQVFEIDFCAGLGIGFGYVSDADYADESNNRRSVSGTVVTLRGAAVNWASSTQRCVTLSTAKTENLCLRTQCCRLFVQSQADYMSGPGFRG